MDYPIIRTTQTQIYCYKKNSQIGGRSRSITGQDALSPRSPAVDNTAPPHTPFRPAPSQPRHPAPAAGPSL